MNDNRFAPARRVTTIFLLALGMVLARPTAASASEVYFQQLEEVAGSIKVVLRVRVLKATSSQERMKLENGREGPVVSVHKDFQCEVNEVVLGKWDLEKGRIVRLRHSLRSAAQYDARGRVTVVVSYSLPHSGMETELKVGDEFLAFLPTGSGVETEQQFLYRAEKLDRREQVLATIAQEKAWALFKQKHAALAKSVLLAGFDAKSRRLALLIGTEGRPVYLVDSTEGTIRTAMSYLAVPMNQIYFDEAHVVLRHNDESPRPIPLNHFK